MIAFLFGCVFFGLVLALPLSIIVFSIGRKALSDMKKEIDEFEENFNPSVANPNPVYKRLLALKKKISTADKKTTLEAEDLMNYFYRITKK